jgi:Hypothetical glycosyl hydrolase family 15
VSRTPPFTRRNFARAAFLLAAGVAPGCSAENNSDGPDTPGVPPTHHIGPKPDTSNGVTRFPRTAASFLAQDVLPGADELAKYDMVVIDSEWYGRMGRRYFDQLRTSNPELCLLAYVNLVDYPLELGDRDRWGGRYALWQYDTPTGSRFPKEWIATTAAGLPVSEWPNTQMTNLTDAAPRFGGVTFAEYAARWVVDRVWRTGVWNGIFLDVWGDRIWSADHAAWDYRLEGTDTPDSEIYGRESPWERGVNGAEVIMRAGMPNAVIVANGTRTMRNGQLNGRVWENFLDWAKDPGRASDLRTYVDQCASSSVRQPMYAMTIDTRGSPRGSADEFRRARYFLTATLLQNGYWAPAASSDYNSLSFYDEFDGAGLERGYLGMPVVANPDFARLSAPFSGGIGTVAPDVYRRDFETGLVIHNSGGTDRVVTFERPMRLIRGNQAPDINSGAVVESILLGGHDGRVLLRID